MDEKELERRRAEARAAGYTDEQIDAFLAGQFDQVDKSPGQQMNRGAEQTLVGGMAAIDTAKNLAVPAIGAYGAKKLYDAYKNRPVAPPPGPAPTPGPAPGSAQYTFESLKSPSGQPAAQPAATRPDTMTQTVRQMAMNKLRQMAPAVRGGMGALSALTPSNIGQNYPFPTSGPLRGSELNPMTRRPWTPEELAAYNANYR